MKGLKKAVSFVDTLAFSISMVSLILLTVTAVFFRFVLGRPIVWCEEVQMILVVWSVFFGASMAVREGGHVAVDIIFDAVKPGVKKVLSVFIWIVVALAIAEITKLEIDRVTMLIKSGLRTSVLRIPSSVEYYGVVAACALMFINHVITGIEGLKGKEEEQ